MAWRGTPGGASPGRQARHLSKLEQQRARQVTTTVELCTRLVQYSIQ